MDEQPRYRWPWLFLLIFLFGCLLAALWLLAEVKRTKQIRDQGNPPATTTETNRL
jgi:ABC-type transporter Mla subunit MlaD